MDTSINLSKETEEKEDRSVTHDPVTVFSGVCNHEYVDTQIDLDGFMCQRCKHCPMGRRKPV